MQVIAFCYENTLFLTTHEIIINKRLNNCVLNMYLYGHVYHNVVHHS